MKKLSAAIATVLYGVLFGVIANSYCLLTGTLKPLHVFVPLFLFANLFAGFFLLNTKSFRLRVCLHGTVLLLAFELSTLISIVYHIYLAFTVLMNQPMTFVWSALLCICVEAMVFWNGIIVLYLSSVQLGIRQRLLGALCGMIPVVNLIVLNSMIHTVLGEVEFERQKEVLNAQRRDQQLCKTKYPILLVHGVFFRDSKFFNYWGRIPRELETNGATVFYGKQHSAASIADCAEELKARIGEILSQTGAEKVNIIAHSKGGLDCRYAIAKLGIGSQVASLTTINTPHRGCLFADYLLTNISPDIKDKVAETYNSTLRKLGEEDPDFLAAVNDLTDAHCKQLDAEMPAPEGIYCQSVGSVLTKAIHGRFPLNFSYHLVRIFSGDNDGLVSEESFAWGEKYTLIKPTQKRGVSHADVIDLNRENVPGFDVREFYVDLVNDLKSRGL